MRYTIRVSAQTVGIVLGLFSAAVAAVLYWGGFVEQARANRVFDRDVEARLKQS